MIPFFSWPKVNLCILDIQNLLLQIQGRSPLYKICGSSIHMRWHYLALAEGQLIASQNSHPHDDAGDMQSALVKLRYKDVPQPSSFICHYLAQWRKNRGCWLQDYNRIDWGGKAVLGAQKTSQWSSCLCLWSLSLRMPRQLMKAGAFHISCAVLITKMGWNCACVSFYPLTLNCHALMPLQGLYMKPDHPCISWWTQSLLRGWCFSSAQVLASISPHPPARSLLEISGQGEALQGLLSMAVAVTLLSLIQTPLIFMTAKFCTPCNVNDEGILADQWAQACKTTNEDLGCRYTVRITKS